MSAKARTLQTGRNAAASTCALGCLILAAAWFGLSPRAAAADQGTPINLRTLTTPIIFKGDAVTAYRDPAAIYHDGEFHLYFTLVKIEPDGKPYLYTAWSKSADLAHWTEPRIFTPRDSNLNFSSPGNVVRFGDQWVLCLQTYPRPNGEKHGSSAARIWIRRSADLESWSEPELLRVKGQEVPREKMGRMIDPCLLQDKDEPGKWWCFFKQNGASMAWSRDLANWTYSGRVEAGENVCVLVAGGEYVMFHSPGNGIGVKRSNDLKEWRDEGRITLGQQAWPWAKGRLTAGFALDLTREPGVGKYFMFFHGSGPEDEKTMFDNFASIGLAWSDDLKEWNWPGKIGSLQPPHAQASNKAKARFAHERHPPPSHGLYEDFRFPWADTNTTRYSILPKSVNVGSDGMSDNTRVTHLLARESTASLLNEARTNGHFYVAQDGLCDPAGFMFGAVNNLGVFTMGDTAPLLSKTRVTAVTPLAARLRLFLDGALASETTGTNLTFEAKVPGSYRIEASLKVEGENRPWIYSSPVYLRALSLTDLQLPSMDISPEVERRPDISYCEGPEADANKHKLDVYTPKGKPAAPVLFFIHGGAWKTGDRSYYPPLGNRYACEGFVTVVPSYRLAPKHKHPAQIEDVAAAFAWTVRHISEYGGDTNRIYVAGHSAGGHLAALLSLDEKALAPYHLSPKLIRGVLALSGVYNLSVGDFQDSVFGKNPQVRRDASPLFHLGAGAPPFLVTYCEWDYFTLPAQAREFHGALKAAGTKAELVYIPGQNHLSELINVASPNDPLVAAALRFMK